MRQVDGGEFIDVIQKDMEQNPEHYKEYVEDVDLGEPRQVELVTNRYLLVDNMNMQGREMSNVIGCFKLIDEAVTWAEIHLDHNKYNVYQVKVVL
jgi:hypothetical protein